ncbi:MAG: glutamine-hydrolyzing carbamoyl-phosphate synthase small subunit [Acidimicrobiia bacterium]
MTQGLLSFSDGTIFEGEICGATPKDGVATGEVVFNTSMSGYQEIISDPSYAGQIITFTSTQIGNYGTNSEDNESKKAFCNGVVIRDLSRKSSNWRATSTLDEYLKLNNIPGICDVDTRALTRFIRDNGALPAAFGTDEAAVKEKAKQAQGTDGQNLAKLVSTSQPYFVGNPLDPYYVVAYDFGIKKSILDHLTSRGCYVEVVPWDTLHSDVMDRNPSGVFLSNGPGDPAAVTGADQQIASLVGNVPLFGICLGHQILGRALKGETYKLEFGHHGGNHPVHNLKDMSIQITSQNHNYVVDPASIDGAEITHVNLNDGTVEGLALKDGLTFSVQHHPEASPGPHESSIIFDDFISSINKWKGNK